MIRHKSWRFRSLHRVELGRNFCLSFSVCSGIFLPANFPGSQTPEAGLSMRHHRELNLVWLCYGIPEWAWRFLVQIFSELQDSCCVLSTNRWWALRFNKKKKKAKNLAQNLIWFYFNIAGYLVKSILLYFLPYGCFSFYTCSLSTFTSNLMIYIALFF